MYILSPIKAHCLILKGSAPLALPNVNVSRLSLFLVRVTSDSGAVERERLTERSLWCAVVGTSVVYVAHC